MRIIFSARTDTGRVRKENQDSYGISEGRNIYFLCDGMGGGAAGDFASRYAAEIMLQTFERVKNDDIAQLAVKASSVLQHELATMIGAIRLANRALSNLASEYPALTGMGTTVAGVLFEPANNVLHIFHAGDSRVYRLRGGALEMLTKDHSKINELLDQGKMKEEEIKTAEIQSMITRALGTAPKVKIDYRPEFVKADDLFMLCTDGLNGEISDEEIKNIMIANRTNMDALASKLIEAANKAGGRDNTTVIALRSYEDKPEASKHLHVPGKVTVFDEEIPEETKAEDRVLKRLMSEAKTQIPRSARERSLISNPLVLGAVIALLVALFGLCMPKCVKEHSYDTQLSDLAGKVTGLRIDIREPIPEQYQVFRKSEDTVTKLQIIQDWYGDIGGNTLPLKDVMVSISDGKREQFKGTTTNIPVEVKLERGSYAVKVHRQGYKLITEKMELKESLNVSIEPSANYKPVVIVMIPQ